MLVRVQHIDGTLEPPLAVEGLGLRDMGMTFSLPDGRWVRVLGFERESDGSRYAVVGEPPEMRTYNALGTEAYVHGAHEMAMGSPCFGTLMLDGSPLDVGGLVQEDTLIWSQDGRYLAATALDTAKPGPWTQVIVISVEAREVVAATVGEHRLSKPVQFIGRGLDYLKYRHEHEEHDWEPAYLAF